MHTKKKLGSQEVNSFAAMAVNPVKIPLYHPATPVNPVNVLLNYVMLNYILLQPLTNF